MAEGFLSELKRRNVFKVATVYLIAGWIVLQVMDVVLPVMGVPDWSFRLILILLLIGFPFALILAWAFEMTPEGIKREKDVDRSKSITNSAGRKIDFAVIGLLAIALVAYFVKDTYFDEPGSGSSSVAVSSEKSIAVLPFASMSADPENEFFSDGLSEELLNVLAQIKELKVAGRTSSFYYKGRNEDLRSIGQQLNVGHVLEGSVRKSGNRVRITAQLISVNDGFHLWSDTYDRELDDIFEIQEEIALAVVDAMKVTLLGEEKVALSVRPTENAQAHSKYLVARTRMRERGQENLGQARALFEQIIKEDPGFAPAYSGLSDSVLLLAGNHSAIPVDESQVIAEKNIQMALTLAPDSDEAWTSKGFFEARKFTLFGKDADFEAAEAAYKHALKLNPDNAEANHWYGILMEQGSQDEKAADLIQRSLELDPLARNPRQRLAGIWVRAGKPDEARNLLEETATLYPDFATGMVNLGNLERNTGHLAKAERWFRRAIDANNDPAAMFSLASLYADLNDLERAKKVLAGIDPDSVFGHAVPVILMAFEGDDDRLYVQCEEELQTSDDKIFWEGVVFAAAVVAGKYDRVLELGPKVSPQLFVDDPQINNVNQGSALNVAYAYKMTGATDKADAMLAKLEAYFDATESDYMLNSELIGRAQLSAVQGNMGKAMDFLQQAYDNGLRSFWNQGIFPLDRDPFLSSLRDDADYQALMTQMRADNERTRQAMAASQ